MKCQECGVEFPAQSGDEICDSCDFNHACAFNWQSFAKGKAEYDDALYTFDEAEAEEAVRQRIADVWEDEGYQEERDERRWASWGDEY